MNNEIFNADIPITIDGSIGSDIEATAVEDAMVTIRNDDFDGAITVSPLMLAEGDDETDVMVTATLPRSVNDAARTVTLTVGGTLNGSTAESPADYATNDDNPENITVDAGMTRGTVTLKIDPEADMGFEGNETIVISGAIDDLNLNLKPATVTIRDAQVQPSVTLTVDTVTDTAGTSQRSAKSRVKRMLR